MKKILSNLNKPAKLLNLLALSLSLTCATAMAAGSIKAAYVEEVIPAKTFNSSVILGTDAKSVGPGTGILGVTSLTFTNFDATAQQVFIFSPVFNAGGSCGSQIIGGTGPQMTVYVPARATIHLTYPSALTFNPVNGQTCIAAQVTTPHSGGVEVDINGFLN